jgi:hypothetical protein
MNPALYKAAALLIAGAGRNAYPGVPGHEPDTSEGEAEKAKVSAAMEIVRRATKKLILHRKGKCLSNRNQRK